MPPMSYDDTYSNLGNSLIPDSYGDTSHRNAVVEAGGAVEDGVKLGCVVGTERASFAAVWCAVHMP